MRRLLIEITARKPVLLRMRTCHPLHQRSPRAAPCFAWGRTGYDTRDASANEVSNTQRPTAPRTIYHGQVPGPSAGSDGSHESLIRETRRLDARQRGSYGAPSCPSGIDIHADDGKQSGASLRGRRPSETIDTSPVNVHTIQGEGGLNSDVCPLREIVFNPILRNGGTAGHQGRVALPSQSP